MASIAIYDSCSLYGNTVRNLLIRVARAHLVQARWTEQIFDELQRALQIKRGISLEKIRRLRQLMQAAVPNCLITGHESLIEGLKLPDPDDRHVLAAAIVANARIIVTANLSDFPVDYLAQWGIVPQTPDDFMLDLIDLNDRVIYACVQQIVDERVNPPETFDEVLRQLERGGLLESAAALKLGR